MFARRVLSKSAPAFRAISQTRTQFPARSYLVQAQSTPSASLLSSRIASLQAQRWYSDAPAAEGKTASTESQSATESSKSEAQVSEADKLKEQLAAKDKQIAELKDQYLRSAADYRNLQARTARETANARSFALEKFVKDLLSSLDNLEAALLSIPPEKLSTPPAVVENATDVISLVHRDLVNLHEGLKMTEEVLIKTLEKHGVERYDPSVGKDGSPQQFDPMLHEAMFLAPKPGAEDGSVMHTQRKGISLNGRVIRAAQVGVVKNS